MLEILSNPDFQKIVLYVVAVNVALSGISAGLAKIKDITATNLDNKIFDILNKVVGFSTAIVDFIGGNRKH